MQIAVVGANGFLGRNLVDKLLLEGHEVLSVINNRRNNINTSSRCVGIEEFVNNSFNPNVIFFAAGSFGLTMTQNMVVHKSLLEIINCYPSVRIIYISSVNVYGYHKSKVNIKSNFNNPTNYGRSKLAGEFIVSSCIDYSILRFSYLYGPKLDNNSFIPKIIDSAATNGAITLYGKGLRKQDYLYIDDAVDLCLDTMREEGNYCFLGASGKSYSNVEVARFVSNHYDCPIHFTDVETGESIEIDIKRTSELLGWSPKTKFSSGIKSMLI